MISQETKKLIVKFLTNQASAKELDELELWLQEPNNKEVFSNFVRTNYAINYNIKKFNSNSVKTELTALIVEEKKIIKLQNRKQIFRYSAAAAITILFVSVFFLKNLLFNTPKENTQPLPVIVNAISPGKDRAILTLANGVQVALEKGENYKSNKAISNGEEISYVNRKKTSSKIAYNYITIPRGGQFLVKLADGTQVWLNSESQLKYPVAFVAGKTREVELVYGEAYFDVSPSAVHNGSKFRVMSNAQEVEVLGTEFNIKSYKDETDIYTTLVEGKVAVSHEGYKENLAPGKQSRLNLLDNSIVIKEVDVYNEISWKEGVFSFERKSLKEIMKVLSRWYDFDVVFATKNIEDKKFIGVLGKDQKIEDILLSIKKFGKINDYEIKEKTIILK